MKKQNASETETLRKEVEDITKNQMEILQLKNTMNKIKSSVDGFKQQNGGRMENQKAVEQQKLPNLNNMEKTDLKN